MKRLPLRARSPLGYRRAASVWPHLSLDDAAAAATSGHTSHLGASGYHLFAAASPSLSWPVSQPLAAPVHHEFSVNSTIPNLRNSHKIIKETHCHRENKINYLLLEKALVLRGQCQQRQHTKKTTSQNTTRTTIRTINLKPEEEQRQQQKTTRTIAVTTTNHEKNSNNNTRS